MQVLLLTAKINGFFFLWNKLNLYLSYEDEGEDSKNTWKETETENLLGGSIPCPHTQQRSQFINAVGLIWCAVTQCASHENCKTFPSYKFSELKYVEKTKLFLYVDSVFTFLSKEKHLYLPRNCHTYENTLVSPSVHFHSRTWAVCLTLIIL